MRRWCGRKGNAATCGKAHPVQLFGWLVPVHHAIFLAALVCEYQSPLRSEQLFGRNVERSFLLNRVSHIGIEAAVVAAFGLDFARCSPTRVRVPQCSFASRPQFTPQSCHQDNYRSARFLLEDPCQISQMIPQFHEATDDGWERTQ